MNTVVIDGFILNDIYNRYCRNLYIIRGRLENKIRLDMPIGDLQ